jgi:hypothetical protein
MRRLTMVSFPLPRWRLTVIGGCFCFIYRLRFGLNASRSRLQSRQRDCLPVAFNFRDNFNSSSGFTRPHRQQILSAFGSPPAFTTRARA